MRTLGLDPVSEKGKPRRGERARWFEPRIHRLLVNFRSRLISGVRKWWAVQDLNLRPSGCKPDALTAELTAQSF
jgi:hypothetical protein